MRNAEEQVVQLGLEAQYGTDPVLDATKAIRAYNVNVTPLAGQTKDRKRTGTGSGSYAVAHLGTYQTLTVDVDLSGAGVPGTEPLWGPLAEACNMAKTTAAGTSVVYTSQSFTDASKSATIYFIWGGKKHKLTGARGEMSLVFQPGDIPLLRSTLTGLYNAAADTVFPDIEATIASWIDGVEFNPDNSTFSLFGASPALNAAQLNLGNQVKYTPRVNAQSVRIPGLRQGGGSLTFEDLAIATKDWLGLAKANTLGALQIVHGKTAGNIVQIDAGKVQLIQPTMQNIDGDLYINSNIGIRRNPGATEFSITVK